MIHLLLNMIEIVYHSTQVEFTNIFPIVLIVATCNGVNMSVRINVLRIDTKIWVLGELIKFTEHTLHCASLGLNLTTFPLTVDENFLHYINMNINYYYNWICASLTGVKYLIIVLV